MQTLFWQCVGGECAEHDEIGELQVPRKVDLRIDEGTGQKRPPATYTEEVLKKKDAFDITFTPRTFEQPARLAPRSLSTSEEWRAEDAVNEEDAREVEDHQLPKRTPRQRDLVEMLELPILRQYKVPPGCTPEDPDRMKVLLEMFQAFTADLHAGMYLTQLTSSREHVEVHCQLMDDLVTLKMDQSNGHIVEFPLATVSKVYRIHNQDAQVPDDQTSQVVVVEFMRRKLAFVFAEAEIAYRFIISLELLIKRAQQLADRAKAKRPLKSAIPQRPNESQLTETCPADLAAQCPSPSPRFMPSDAR